MESKNLYRIGAEKGRRELKEISDMRIPANIIFDAGDEYKVENRMWQGVPSVAKTKKRIWAAWFSGGKYEPCLEN